MKRILLFIFQLVALVMLCGCASDKAGKGGKVWYQPGKSAEETRRDTANCKLMSEQHGNPLAMLDLGFAIADKARKNNMFNSCMVEKGYSLVDKNSAPSGFLVSEANVQQQSQADITLTHKLIGHWISEHVTDEDGEERQVELTFLADKKFVAKTVTKKGATTNTDSKEGTYCVQNEKLTVYHSDFTPQPTIFYFTGETLVIKPPNIDREMRLRKGP